MVVGGVVGVVVGSVVVGGVVGSVVGGTVERVTVVGCSLPGLGEDGSVGCSLPVGGLRVSSLPAGPQGPQGPGWG